jgi:hypothetical protein
MNIMSGSCQPRFVVIGMVSGWRRKPYVWSIWNANTERKERTSEERFATILEAETAALQAMLAPWGG